MRKLRFYILPLCLISTSELLAASDANVVELIQYLDTVKMDEIMCAEGDNYQKQNDPLAEKCAIDLCGRPEEMKPSKTTLATIDDYLDRLDISERIAPLIPELEKSWGRIEEYHAKKIEELKEFSNPERVRRYLDNLSNDDFARIHSDHLSTGERTQFAPGAAQWPTPYDAFDYSTVPREYQEQVKKFVHKQLMKDATAPRALSYSSDKKFVEKQLKIFEDQLSREVEQYNNENPDQKIDNPINGADYKKQPTNNRIGDLSILYEKLEYKNKKKNCDEDCLKLLTGLISKKSSEILKVYQDNANKMKLFKDDFMLECKTYAALSNHAKSRFDELKNKLPQYFQQYQNKMSPYMSEKSLKKLGEILNKISFSNDGLRPTPETLIKNNIEDIERLKEPNVNRNLSDDYRYFKKAPSRFPNPASSLGLCSDYSKHTIWDYARARTPEPEINLSHYTCLNHQLDGRADSIIFHEISHVVDFQGSQFKAYSSHTHKIMDEQRKCVASQHKGLAKDKNGLNFNVTEDYADFLAAIASDDFIKAKSTRCEGLKVDNQHTKFTDLHFKQNPNDNHSDNLFRIIHTKVATKKPLPQSCLELLEKYKDDYEFKDCSQ